MCGDRMRALTADGAGELVPAEVERPVVGANQVLVAVRASSANFGEIMDVVPTAPHGFVPGWEAVGTVLETGCGTTRLRPGDLVATLGFAGGWAEYRVVDEELAFRLPSDSSPAAMAVVGVAGGTAIRAIRRLGSTLGVRVMVTGAASAVGFFTIQLLAKAGACVVAVDPKVERHSRHRELGAAETLVTPEENGEPLGAVVDTVGGSVLVHAFRQLRAHGRLIAVGHTAREQETFQVGDLEGGSGRHGRVIETMHLLQDDLRRTLVDDIEWLARLVNDGDVLIPDTVVRGFSSFASSATLKSRSGGWVKTVLEL
ncbi:zinc-binding dehydrogenase [Actinokineospora sp. PR83]|uniref:alcohol dehydrogenase catalytic domain-containing protein n=1 Tax=Actinokineospora sp. PR83 TaxID=2884908 RepID=UPI001F2E5A03|nr:zinc-binding dehydrogenase [Actinokineospora sp. PR83]MCG8917199.1 zinc-binding dehydrogenase [Actinokineospora sp. PR83]